MQRNSEGSSPIICQAIRQLRKLIFHYNGLQRVVAPYCYGISTRDTEVLRGVQIGGASNSHGYGFGKLWSVSEMTELQLSTEHFEPNDPLYNPNDSAMKRVICRVD
jgi:hypothetical protein